MGLTVTAYEPSNWFTPSGAKKKLKELQNKGMPSLKHWHMITLTVDPLQFSDPQEAYEYIKPRLRKWVYLVRQHHNQKNNPYFWKLEFQQNGWPHWHLCFYHGKGRKLDVDFIERTWKFGATNCRYNKTDTDYLFKYVSKVGQELPNWVLHYPQSIRVFQSSNLFRLEEKFAQVMAAISKMSPEYVRDYLNKTSEELDIITEFKEQEEPGSRRFYTIKEKLEKWRKQAVISWEEHETTRRQLITLKEDFNTVYSHVIQEYAVIPTELSEIMVDFRTFNITHRYISTWISKPQEQERLEQQLPHHLLTEQDSRSEGLSQVRTLWKETPVTEPSTIWPNLRSLMEKKRMSTQ
ncbi:MAG: hypothetical protein CL885_01700 [Dehalococcoidia bacterium]|nr:hypothetical protein [Dehalococcoidia bacterium]